MISSRLKAMYVNYILINQSYILMGKYAVRLADHHGKQTMIPRKSALKSTAQKHPKALCSLPTLYRADLISTYRDHLGPVSPLFVESDTFPKPCPLSACCSSNEVFPLLP